MWKEPQLTSLLTGLSDVGQKITTGLPCDLTTLNRVDDACIGKIKQDIDAHLTNVTAHTSAQFKEITFVHGTLRLEFTYTNHEDAEGRTWNAVENHHLLVASALKEFKKLTATLAQNSGRELTPALYLYLDASSTHTGPDRSRVSRQVLGLLEPDANELWTLMYAVHRLEKLTLKLITDQSPTPQWNQNLFHQLNPEHRQDTLSATQHADAITTLAHLHTTQARMLARRLHSEDPNIVLTADALNNAIT